MNWASLFYDFLVEEGMLFAFINEMGFSVKDHCEGKDPTHYTWGMGLGPSIGVSRSIDLYIKWVNKLRENGYFKNVQ